jgi:hypothetical protein
LSLARDAGVGLAVPGINKATKKRGTAAAQQSFKEEIRQKTEDLGGTDGGQVDVAGHLSGLVMGSITSVRAIWDAGQRSADAAQASAVPDIRRP